MSKKYKLISKIGALFLALLMTVTVFSSTVVSAKSKEFNLDIKKSGEICRTTEKYLRDTTSVDDAWKIKLTYSDETTKGAPDGSAKTATKFWLGIYNKNGTNPVGSEKHNVIEGSGWKYFSAKAAASNKEVYLYASDNNTTNSAYSVKGKWYPYSGHKPDNA